MRMKNIMKRIAAVGTAAVMTAGMMGMSALAATPTINEEEPISLTIHKYVTEQSGEIGLDSSVTGKEVTIPDTYLPLNDVTFSVVKVADIIQEGDTAGNNGVKYELTEAGAGVFESLVGEKKTSLELNEAVKEKTGLALTEFLESFNGPETVVSKITAGEGTAAFKNEDLVDGQGLYLVVETEAPKEVTKRSVPFLVSLPMTDKETMDDWMYNVHAYPKNTTAVTDVEKKIVEVAGDTEGIAKDQEHAQAQIGETITYQVPATAVVPEGGLSKLGITDVMSKGLTFKTETDTAKSTDVQIYAGTSAVAENQIAADNYTVKTTPDGDGGTILEVYFTQDYIDNIINTSEDKNPEFLFVYQSILNENAIVGQTGNNNDVDMYYNYNTNPNPESDIKVEGNETKVYTWGIDLTKTGDNEKLLAGVEFTLKKGDSTGVDMEFILNPANAYVPAENGGSTTLITNAEGQLVIRGLKSGTYTLTETKTAAGYVLLKDSITIVIDGNEDDGTATATVAGKAVNLIEDAGSLTALIPITVVNHTGFDLPKTGEVGTAMFTIVGVILVLVSAYFLLTKKKKAVK